MPSPPQLILPEQPHLVSLVLQSKKALQHGEQLCSKANALSNASAHSALEVLALDAKVRWITDAVLEQLKLAASVAKSIELKRSQLNTRVHEWDDIRAQRADTLDNILESLGSQLVPLEFYEDSANSSIFGSQHLDDKAYDTPFDQSPSNTVRQDSHRGGGAGPKLDRSKWKTLRDFVDERAIEDALESMENDRSALDDVLATTNDYPESLASTMSSIRNSLPTTPTVPSIDEVLNFQVSTSTHMAGHLESLAGHYEQMASALRDSEAGEAFSEDDLQDMNRDTEELPSIMAELEESVKSIEASHQKVVTAKDETQQQVDAHHRILDDLDELGDIMADMLQQQEVVENGCEEHLDGLQQHLLTLEDLHHRFTSFQTTFNKLLVEIARRRQYREAAEAIVRGMQAQLDAMTDEERQVRVDFNTEHGAHLPTDICLCIENPPTRWQVGPCDGEVEEVLPNIDADLLAKARSQVVGRERSRSRTPGSESL